ncbi:MAG TPA: bifunctional methylenetetrahydrofolate dehydrogenase/methenyltetrahydrofolate cyclohydrolase FolD [Bacillota bacterium]|nr:bifunctional methylenetetrahydrofolate dehydrogenase/methenyltetrahydrofolate cyclohydrolase FolD [Bacillota bacterium]HPF42811.1 bifunctional methylenetetrahydrofolate dehydrogenase/methenyltetrahydrofolate cyclohydrolase FolD [Bacillota bacterium]HPJ85832.1 bifunctional methylenetetrahydrofolate dehydrogenase/methenyltetrahydrofolate cyclohydrolase FolD [Bacillota bacterium]HPQ61557.1 bifunctional methylenetetrahydrofolate dehydrogenase/methenyltetrahydrofolate cyclohydrolase FolD [Bacillot
MAIIMDGKKLSKTIREKIAKETEILKIKYGKTPKLAVIVIGNDPAGESYVAGKEKACRNVGIESVVYHKEETVSQAEMLELIGELNSDDEINGILLQMPVPRHLNKDELVDKISPQKDVDGFTPENVANLTNSRPAMVPCTPLGIMELLEAYEINPEGKRCVVIGRSQIVGKPVASLLLAKNGTVTICHSKTKDLPAVAREADILVAATGKPKMVDDTFIKEGAAVIDVGISRVDGQLTGDVDFDKVEKKAGYITPVPGGVGPMTVACLLENTLLCFKRMQNENGN